MVFLIHLITILVAVFEHQFTFTPIAANAFHTEAFAAIHQPFWEETRQMTNAAYDDAAEDVAIIAHLQHFVDSAFVFVLLHGIHVHCEAFRADLNDPTVALLGIKVIQHGEFLQGLVPPIHLAVTLIDIFMRYFLMLAFVIKRIDFYKDVSRLVLDNRVASLIHILVGDAAIGVEDLVVPFGAVQLEARLN